MNTRTLRHAAAALVLAAVLTPAAGFCARHQTLGTSVAHQASSLWQSFVRMLLDVGISMDGNG